MCRYTVFGTPSEPSKGVISRPKIFTLPRKRLALYQQRKETLYTILNDICTNSIMEHHIRYAIEAYKMDLEIYSAITYSCWKTV